MALAEILNVFPVFMRRARIVRYLTAFVISMALGKGIGACLFFFRDGDRDSFIQRLSENAK